MPLSLFSKKLGKLPIGINNRVKHNIYPQKDFIRHIEKERERANRNRHELSLLVIDFASAKVNPSRKSVIINHIRSTVRSIDEMGWYDQKRFGITLPYTNQQGANHLAGRIFKSLNSVSSEIVCEVHTYPSEKC